MTSASLYPSEITLPVLSSSTCSFSARLLRTSVADSSTFLEVNFAVFSLRTSASSVSSGVRSCLSTTPTCTFRLDVLSIGVSRFFSISSTLACTSETSSASTILSANISSEDRFSAAFNTVSDIEYSACTSANTTGCNNILPKTTAPITHDATPLLPRIFRSAYLYCFSSFFLLNINKPSFRISS